MENQHLIEEPKESMWSVALKYGLIGGLALMVLSLIMHLSGMENIGEGKTSILSSITNYAIMIGAIAMSIHTYKAVLGNQISFGNAFKTGMFTSLIMGVMMAVWMFIFFTFISPETLDMIAELAAEEMEGQGLEDEEIEAAQGMMGMFMSVPFFAFTGFLGTFITGVVMSLVGGLIFKTE